MIPAGNLVVGFAGFYGATTAALGSGHARCSVTNGDSNMVFHGSSMVLQAPPSSHGSSTVVLPALVTVSGVYKGWRLSMESGLNTLASKLELVVG